MIFISQQVRQRRLYHALAKYELDTIADYMPFFKDTFIIRRLHRKKKIFRCCKFLYAFRFSCEIKVIDSPNADAVYRGQRQNNDYHVGTDTDLNITNELENRQHKSQVYSFRDNELGVINK